MKVFLKQLLFSFSAILMLPLTGLFYLLSLVLPSDPLLAGFSQFLSLIPGKSGVYLRAGFYRFTLTKCSPDAVVSFSALLSQVDTVIEEGCYIGPQCNIGKCKIGKNTLIGSGVHVMSGTGQHDFSDLSTPIKDQGGHFEQITVGEDCWVGNCALIMANIGKGAVIGAGSVVTTDIPDYGIAVGNPAKVIKTRLPESQ